MARCYPPPPPGTKWLCTYALHSHIQAAHPIMAPPYFLLGRRSEQRWSNLLGRDVEGNLQSTRKTPCPTLPSKPLRK